MSRDEEPEPASHEPWEAPLDEHALSTLVSIARNSVDNIMLLDIDCRIVFINRTVPDLRMSDVIGVPVFAFVPQRWHENMRRCFDDVARTRQPGTYEVEYHAVNGTVSYWHSRVGPVVRGGKVTGFTVNSTNITEQRHLEADRERFFTLSVDLLCIAGTDGALRRINPAFMDTLGWSEQDLLRSPFVEIVHPDDRANAESVVDRLRQGGQVFDFEVRCLCADGSHRRVSWRAKADAVGEVFYAVGRDVTEQRAMTEQLQRAQKLEAVGRLAGGIAHDFNNLVLIIQANARLAGRTSNSCELGECLAAIVQASERAARLIRQLLTFAQRRPAKRERVVVASLVQDTVNMVRRIIPENIDIDVVSGDPSIIVEVDRSQLEQVLVNLCLNARDSMATGGRALIEVEPAPEPDKHDPAVRMVALRVTDNGGGMDPAIRDRVFEPFFSTKDPGKGTGLGLSTVYGIVRQHGGRIQVASERGQGTMVEVLLPIADGPIDEPKEPRHQVSTSQGRETILVAEDDAGVRSVVLRILEAEGYKVLVAKDGEEALTVLGSEPNVACALLDIVMPRIDGPSVVRKAREFAPGVRFLFTSGYSAPSTLSDPDVCSIPLLPKPYAPDDLIALLRATLDE